MAYGLPARGQANWDNELNNSMEALRADVTTAKSDASVARSESSQAVIAVNSSKGIVDGQAEQLINDPASRTATALRDQSPRPGWALDEATEVTATGVIPTGSLRGIAYGMHPTNGGMYQSKDDGATWTLVTGAPTPYGGVHDAGDGEVLVNASGSIRRSAGWSDGTPSAATWTTVLTANLTSSFLACDLDTYDKYAIAAEYAVPRTDARYVYVSSNNGRTWTTVRDLDAMHPGQSAQDHWHSVALDPWAGLAQPRLWASHGDNPIAGVYYSDNLGSTWTLYESGWQPMTLMATRNGIVTTTDQSPDGVWLIPRNLAARRSLIRLKAPAWAGSLLGFGTGAIRDRDGTVYLLFGTDQQAAFTSGVPAAIFATDGERADIIYRTAQTAAAGGSVQFEGRPTLTTSGKLLASYRVGANRYTITGLKRRGVPGGEKDPGNVLTGRAPDRHSVVIGSGTSSAASSGVVIGALSGTTLTSAMSQLVLVGEESEGNANVAAVGYKAKGALHGTAVGWTADAGSEGVAVGSNAKAVALGISIGRSVNVTGTNGAIGIGRQLTVAGTQAVLISPEFGAAGGSGAVRIGVGGLANGADSIGIGTGPQASVIGCIAIGTSALASDAYAVAIGAGAEAIGSEDVAIGRLARVPTGILNSVALGGGSVATQWWQVMIGPRDLEITDAAKGVVLKSPIGTRYRVKVTDAGALTVTAA